ncbi:uncharacterized protein TNIN_392071 [Trichonephila inaurata madagascariensis]|uniref:Uncharacterized protein n=1 Tax=Trichonephila inaurata madagascariensis TaxID=2747483 RepID=A0A8X6XE37_9ARAC|nr:uncharacterized protein TNIN_392071 [Trichonephila inaurata madagascariensis]
MKMKFSGNRTQPEDHELTAESPESIQHRSKSVTVSGTKDADSQSTKGDYAAPHAASTAVDVEGDTSRSKQFNSKSFCRSLRGWIFRLVLRFVLQADSFGLRFELNSSAVFLRWAATCHLVCE